MRTATDIRVTIWRTSAGVSVQRDIKIVTSSMAGGRIRTETQRFEALSNAEAASLLDVMAGAILPGDEVPTQQIAGQTSLFNE